MRVHNLLRLSALFAPRKMNVLVSALIGRLLSKCSFLSRYPIAFICIAGALAIVWPANGEIPKLLAATEHDDFSETPPKRFIENRPVAARLRPATKRAPKLPALPAAPRAGPVWTALGPFPIPNGQTENRTDPVSGRVSAIAIHPTNPLTAYVGTAQGGLYRTLDGGTTWTQLMDNAISGTIGTPLAIGAITIDPTDSTTIFVGTGEGNLSADSFFGNGLYIITNADTFNPTLNGPYGMRGSDGADIFSGRSIVSIAVDPSNHNNIFCATSSGVGGIVPDTYSALPPRGLYRSTNAFAGINGTGTPTFTLLSIVGSETNAIVTSAVIEPGDASNLVCALYSQSGTSTGGIYRSTNALAATPTFTKTLALPDFTNVKLAINKVLLTVTVYATTEEGIPNGRLYKSSDGGATFGSALTAVNGFAGLQGFYDITVAVDPTNANNIYLGGSTGSNIFLISNDGGSSFVSSVTGLHADVHAIAVAPSNPTVIYHGNDGGIWKSVDSGLNWTSLNNATFSATQFQDLALHPIDRFFSIGGTQDNGTEFLRSDASFLRVDFGDGGYSLIDQNAFDTINVTMYHTYFSLTGGGIGTARVLTVPCASDGNWSFHGAFTRTPTGPYCDGTFDMANGIAIGDDVNFYAPQALGPGNPNTWYFGTDKLYRSTDKADTATAVSQVLESGVPISAIAISPQDDNVRVVGLNDGRVFATTNGSTMLVQIAGLGATNGRIDTPATGVGRIAIDPNNKAIAYICFNGFGTTSFPIDHVWKTTNLTSSFVAFAPVSSGLPDIPVNAIAIDPAATDANGSTNIYAGTDAGVYHSPDAGASWSIYGSGFPHCAVFGLEIQNSSRTVRAATHGRGLYETTAAAAVVTPTPTPTPTPSPTPPNPYGEITDPPAGSTLASSTVTFTWEPGNAATAYWLTVGSTLGGTDIFSSGQTGGHFFTVSNIPTDGRTIFVRLRSLVGGIWYNPPQDYTYTAQAVAVLTPVISPKPGTYRKKVTVAMACATPQATIYYTLDGTIPTTTSTLYQGPFLIRQRGTLIVRAKAFKTGVPDSQPATSTYKVR